MKKPRSLGWLAGPALAAVLLMGLGASKAYAWDNGRVSFRGSFGLPHGRVSVFAGHRGFFPHRSSFVSHRFGRPFFRPFRVVRVRVFDPFPHWVFRRVYVTSPVGSYCAPY